MILGNEAIEKLIACEVIVANPFEPSLIQGASIDVRLGPAMYEMSNPSKWVRDQCTLDPINEPDLARFYTRIEPDQNGVITLESGRFYLATTYESIGTKMIDWATYGAGLPRYVLQMKNRLGGVFQIRPDMRAKSTTGRLGLSVALCAGCGDPGYCGVWGLEVRTACLGRPLTYKIPVGTIIGQVSFEVVFDCNKGYAGEGRYQSDIGGSVIRLLPKNLKVLL